MGRALLDPFLQLAKRSFVDQRITISPVTELTYTLVLIKHEKSCKNTYVFELGKKLDKISIHPKLKVLPLKNASTEFVHLVKVGNENH